MMLFAVLLLLIILISASLAYLSMREFPRSPEDFEKENGLFLIRRSAMLTPNLLLSVRQEISKKGFIFSLERLFKGNESVLVIYGPLEVLKPFIPILDLVELEDYADAKILSSAWEFGIESGKNIKKESIFDNFPMLTKDEQVWWQMVLEAKGPRQFKAQIRAVVISETHPRREKIFKTLGGGIPFTKITQPLSSGQILDFYKKRSMISKKQFTISAEEIVRLLRLS